MCGQSTNSASDATDPEPAYKLSCGHVYPFVFELNHVHGHQDVKITIKSRRRRKKALLRVNDRGGVWRMCILALCRACVSVRVFCTCVRAPLSN